MPEMRGKDPWKILIGMITIVEIIAMIRMHAALGLIS
jgi:hypothetical protein